MPYAPWIQQSSEVVPSVSFTKRPTRDHQWLSKRLSGDEEKDLLHEINILSRLSHPNIATYVIMELGEEDLSSLLFDLQRDLDWARRLNIAVQVAQALEYLHTQNPPILYQYCPQHGIPRGGATLKLEYPLQLDQLEDSWVPAA
jgi:serine/threonine protein kinase